MLFVTPPSVSGIECLPKTGIWEHPQAARQIYQSASMCVLLFCMIAVYINNTTFDMYLPYVCTVIMAPYAFSLC